MAIAVQSLTTSAMVIRKVGVGLITMATCCARRFMPGWSILPANLQLRQSQPSDLGKREAKRRRRRQFQADLHLRSLGQSQCCHHAEQRECATTCLYS